MSHDFYALITKDSPRAAHFLEVFQGLPIPIKSPIPINAELPGIGHARVVEIAVDLLTADQRERLAAHIARQFDQPLDFVQANLATIGCPIRLDDDVFIEILNAQKWIN